MQQAHKEDRIAFAAVTPWPGRYICAEGRYLEGGGDSGSQKRAGIFVGPEFGTVARPDLVAAAREAGDAGPVGRSARSVILIRCAEVIRWFVSRSVAALFAVDDPPASPGRRVSVRPRDPRGAHRRCTLERSIVSHINSFSAVRYRAIGGLTLDSIAPVNVVTGSNGVGKTSLLEAIWLLNGRFSPGLPWNSNVQRSSQAAADPLLGLSDGAIELRGTECDVTCSWKATFESTPLAGTAGPGSSPRGNGSPQPARAPSDPGQSSIPVVGRLRVWLDGREVLEKTEVLTSRGGVIVPLVALPAGRPGAIIQLPLSLMDTENEVINRFSQLVRNGAKGALRDRLQLVLPRLTDVEVVTNEDSKPFILATTKDNDRLPLQALGGGMQRLFRLFVCFGECPRGLVLVDEIENGLHHRVLPELWRQLSAMAREFDVQLFATTHSHECLLAALDAFDDNPDDIAVHALYRTPDDGSVRAATYAGGALQAAREIDLELR